VYAPQRAEAPFEITRLGVVMQPFPDEARETWGVLNPACARGRDGQLYLFPRIVAAGNYSRIALCRVRFGPDGNPAGVERLAIALEPREPYELLMREGGGCEDPRITYLPALDRYVMAYTALGDSGPRVALAISYDLFTWRRLGVVNFAAERGIDWNAQGDKDAMFFPEPVRDPQGRPALALLHRPTYQMAQRDGQVDVLVPEGEEDHRESVWISYVSLEAARADAQNLTRLDQHELLATPLSGWEGVKIGAGAPPVLTHLGWLLTYHGVGMELHTVTPEEGAPQRYLRYSAGVMVLDRDDPRRVLYRSPEPVLEPATQEERVGIVSDVVFPTGIDLRTPPGPGARLDVYYGMADRLVGAGMLTLPATLPGVIAR
jgi:predicted GH43/DUF377 family glycosyl hydrolase